MTKEKIKVAIFPNHKKVKGTLTPLYDIPHDLSLVLDIWSYINKELQKKYDIDISWIKNDNYDDSINDIHNDKYDVVIGAFFPSYKRRKLVNFSDTYLYCRPILVYSPENKRTELKKYLVYLLSVWIIPILILIFFGIFFGLFAYVFKQESPAKGDISFMTSIYYLIAGFLGQSGGVLSITKLKHKKNIFLGVITFFFIYFFGIYVTASTTAKSVSYLQTNYKLEYSIKNMRILVYPGWQERLVKMNGGLTVLLPKDNSDIETYYLDNKKKLKLDGFILLPFNKLNTLKTSNLIISKYMLKYYHAAFPVNKKKNTLLKDINLSIIKMQDNDKLFNTCALWSDKNYVMC